MRHFIVAAGIFLSTLAVQAQVWTDVNTWTPEWETRYQNWVRTTWSKNFFALKNLADGRENPYYGLRLDCADVVYSMRVIFAADNNLPFAIQDPTGSGRLISNRMTRFNNARSDQSRLRSFLAYLHGVVATKTLPNDTFPVALSPQWIKSGILMLTTKANHHSWSVKEILPIGVPWLVFNSRVSASSSIVLQERQSWPNPYWVFESNHTPAGAAGFRAFRPLDYLGRPVWEVPGYSEEQYRTPLNKWVKIATSRLALRQETNEQLLRRLMKASCESLQGRVEAVRDGVIYLRQSGGRCMNYETYDNFSTPNRDQRLFDDLVVLRVAYKEMFLQDQLGEIPAELKTQLNKIFPAIQHSARAETTEMRPQTNDARSVCLTTYDKGKTIDLAEGKRRLFAGLMSNNPMDDLEYRWGERRGPSPRARACPSWDPWSPDLSQSN